MSLFLDDAARPADFPRETPADAKEAARRSLGIMLAERQQSTNPALEREIQRTAKLAGVSSDTVAPTPGVEPAPERRGVSLFMDDAPAQRASSLFYADDAANVESQPVMDTAKSGAAGVLSGTGATLRGIGHLMQEGGNAVAAASNKVLGTDLRSENPLGGAADWLESKAKALNDSRSEAGRVAERGSQPTGDLLNAIKTGDFSQVSFGESPSLNGYIQLGVNVFGQMLPIIAGTLLTRSPVVAGATLGGAQGGGAAVEQARDSINDMKPEQLAAVPLYKERIAAGDSPADAKQAVQDAAQRWAFLLTTPISALGGAITGKIIHGGVNKIVPAAVAKTAAGRIATAIPASMAEEGIQETAEGVATNAGVNLGTGTQIPLGEGSMQNAVLGALGGAGPGAVGAAHAPASKPAPTPEPYTLTIQGKQVSSPEQLAAAFSSMHANERLTAVAEAIAKDAGIPVEQFEQEHEYHGLLKVFETVAPSKQAEVLGQMLWPDAPTAAAPAAEEAPAGPVHGTVAPEVDAKKVLKLAEQRLRELNVASGDLSTTEVVGFKEGKPIIKDVKERGRILSDAEKTELEFLRKNVENPEEIAKHYGITVEPESLAALKAEKVKAEEKPAKEEKKPTAKEAVGALEADAATVMNSVKLGTSTQKSAFNSTVGEAAKTLQREQEKTEAAKKAIETSKRIEQERAVAKQAREEQAAKQKAESAKPKQEKAPSANQAKAPSRPAKNEVAREAPAPKKEAAKPVQPSKPVAKPAPVAEKLAPISKAEQAMVKEARDVLKKNPGTKTPVALVQRELGVPNAVARELVAHAQAAPTKKPKKNSREMTKAEQAELQAELEEGLKNEADFARKHKGSSKPRRVSVGLAPGNASPLSTTQQGEIAPEKAEAVIKDLARMAGVKIVGSERGVGAYMQFVEGSLQIDTGGSDEAVNAFMDMIGYALQQTEVIATRVHEGGTHHAVDLFSPDFADLEKSRQFFDAFLKYVPRDPETGEPIAPGFQQARIENVPALRFLNFSGLWDVQQLKGIISALEQASDETDTKVTDTVAQRAEFTSTGNDWSANAQGQSYLAALRNGGRLREAAELERRYAPSRPAEEVAAGERPDFASASQRAVNPEGGKYDPKSWDKREAAHDVLIDAIGQHLASTGQGTKADAREMFNSAPPATTEERLAQEVARRFGHEVVFFTNLDPARFDFDGVAPQNSKYIFINKSSDRATMQVVGHELLHKLRQNDEGAYQALVRELRKYFDEKGYQSYRGTLSNTLAKGETLAEGKIEEEFLADGVGEAFTDPYFWEEMGKREPGFFRRILSDLIGLLNNILDFSKGYTGENNGFFTNVNKTRSIIADAFASWVRQQPEYQETTRSNAFANWFGASKTIFSDGTPVVFYHGTARAFGNFRPKQANAIFFTPNAEFATAFTDNAMQWLRMQDEAMKHGAEPFDPEVARAAADRAPLIYPVFVKAERPFDSDNKSHVAMLSEWLDERFKNDADFRHAQTLLGIDQTKPEFSVSKQHLIERVAEGSWGAIENEVTQRFIKMKGFDGFHIYEEGTKNLAVYSPSQVKSIFNENFDDGPQFARKPTAKERLQFGQQVHGLFSKAAQQYMNDPNKQRGLAITQSQKVLDLIHQTVGKKMSPLGDLPSEDAYLVQRNVAQGYVAQANELAEKVADVFSKADDKEKANVFKFWTTVYHPASSITNPEIRQAAQDVKKMIEQIGEKLVKRGLLEESIFEENRGRYLPRLYLKHLLNEGDWRAVGTGKKLSDLGYTKKRQDIEEEVRLAILGEIRDPGFLGAMAVAKPMRDLALIDFMHQISKNEDWVWKPSILQYKGHDVSVKWLENEKERLEQQLAFYKDPAIIKRAKDEIQDLQTALTAAQVAAGGKTPADFKALPDTPQYGYLRGMLVRNEIHSDLVGSATITPEDASFWEKMVGHGGAATKFTQVWKGMKVSLNPPAQIRNALSNLILLHLSGIPMAMIPVRIGQAAEAIRTKNKYFEIAQRYGLSTGTFGQQELFRIQKEFLNEKGGSFSMLRWASVLMDRAGEVYQKMETIGKIAKLIDEMERRKVDETTAAVEANKWLFDYSLVPPSVRYMRNAPIGVPFVTFYYKLLPRLMEVALKYPWRFAPYVGMSYVLPMAIASMVGASADDLDKLKKALPEWLREHGHVYMIPKKDENGRWTFLDLSYIMPWSMFTDVAKQVSQGKISEALKTTGLLSGPVQDIASALRTNTDSFTGQQIANPGDPTYLKLGAWLTWAWNMAMPPIITNRGLIGPDLGNPAYPIGGKAVQATTGQQNRFGDERTTVGQAISYAFGMNLYPVNPEHSRAGEMLKMQFELQEAKRRLMQNLRDPSMSEETRARVMGVGITEIKRRMDKLQQYAEESQIPASLQ